MSPALRPVSSLCRPLLQGSKLASCGSVSTITPQDQHRSTSRRCEPSTKPSSARSSSLQQIRWASTTASVASSGTSLPPNHLDWNTFFSLRTARRRYALLSSVLTSAGTTVGGVSVLSQQDIDALGLGVFGLDPFVVLGLITAGFAVTGWLTGPVFGTAVFNLVNGGYRDQIAAVSELSSSTSCRRSRLILRF